MLKLLQRILMPLKGEFVVKKTEEKKKVIESLHSSHANPSFEHQPVGFFSAYCLYPENVTFENQDANEQIILFLRRHFITNFYWIASVLTLSLLPLLFAPFFTGIVEFLATSPATNVALLFFYYLLLFGFVILRFSLWYYHVTLVTNKRVLDIDIINILNKDVAEALLEVIQDVQYTQSGILASFLNFGDIRIQTESLEQKFEIDATPRPKDVARIIGDLVEEAKKDVS